MIYQRVRVLARALSALVFGGYEMLRLPASPDARPFAELLIAHRGAGTCAPENTLLGCVS